MRCTLTPARLAAYVARQISHHFPDEDVQAADLAAGVDAALARVAYCFARVRQKYFCDNTGAQFNHLHTDQYAMFLGYLGNQLFRTGASALANKVYALNKALHALDLFGSVNLPDVFCLQHPVGTVLGGGATYSNYLFVYQGCTVGGDLFDVYPTLKEGIVMFAGSAILGPCTVGENCWIAAGTIIKSEDIPPNSLVFGVSPRLVIKPAKRQVVKFLFEGVR